MVSMSVPIIFFFLINEKVPVVESLFSEVTGEFMHWATISKILTRALVYFEKQLF